MTTQNTPTYLLDEDLKRNSEYAGTPFNDTESADYNLRLGCNKAASNAPHIGIATGLPNPSYQLDAVETAAHRGEHIGHTPDATTTIKVVEGVDVNNTLVDIAVDAGGAADDAIADAGTGAVNRTGAAVVENDRIWGVIPVA